MRIKHKQHQIGEPPRSSMSSILNGVDKIAEESAAKRRGGPATTPAPRSPARPIRSDTVGDAFEPLPPKKKPA